MADDRAPAGLNDSTPTPPSRRRPVLWALLLVLLGASAAAALFVAAAAVGPTATDLAVLSETLQLRSGDLTTVAVAVTEIGSTVSMAVLASLVALWSLLRGRLADAVLVFGAMVGAAAVFRGLKLIIDRPRPPVADRLVEETNQSLPSGHATMSMVVVGILVVLVWPRLRAGARVVLVAAAAGWVGAVGATRIYLGVHWFSDVVAGWLVGAAWLAACVLAWSWWRRRAAHRAELAAAGPGVAHFGNRSCRGGKGSSAWSRGSRTRPSRS